MHTKTLSLPFIGTKRKMRSLYIGWLGLGIAIICASTSTTYAKMLTGSLSPLSLLFVSESIVLVFTILSFGLFPIMKELRKKGKNCILPLMLIGVTSSIIAPLLVFTGLQMSQAINAELYLRTYTIFLFLFASIFLREKITRTDIFALVCTFSGVAIVITQGFTAKFTPETSDLLIIFGALVYAIGGVIFKKKMHKLHPELILFVRSSIAIVFFLIVSPFVEHNLISELEIFPYEMLGALIGYGLIARFLYLLSFYESIERLPIHTVAMILPLITIGSLLFAHVMLGEHIAWYHIFGGLMIIIGSAVVQLTSKNFKAKYFRHHLRHGNRHHV